MKHILKSIILLIFSGMFSCQKNINKITDGTYTGRFTVYYNSGIKTGITSVEFKKGRFVCKGNTDRIPAGGSGSFSIEENKIKFNDENFWTADFDWNLVLDGTYNYSFNGKKLLFSANKNNVGTYKYDLTRQ